MSTKALADLQASSIDSILQEDRKFDPPAEFSRHAQIQSLEEYEDLYKESIADPDKFWSRIASELHWFKKWDKVIEWNTPWAKWFVGGQINLSYNCLDRHVLTARKNKAAIIWESEPGEVRTLTYQQLHREVQKFSNVLKALGVKKNDRVAIYMGMTPELPIAMLACARIGAPHTVVFGGFSSNALIDRIHDCQATAVITQDGSYRRGAEVKLFPAVEEALKSCPTVKNVVIYKRTGTPINLQSGRDQWRKPPTSAPPSR
jgi:acetyl-CoA synthetase